MIVTLCVRVERNHKTILPSGVLLGANQFSAFLSFATVYIFGVK